MNRKLILGLMPALLLLAAASAHAQMRLTEWAYDASGGEFMEFTNFGGASIDMTNWSQDDSNHTAGKHAFGTTFGVVFPGESVIVTESAEAAFRTAWSLPAAVKVFGGYSNDNLGRSDEIYLYDNASAQIDRLTFNDQGSGAVAGPRTSGFSGNIPFGALGSNNASSAVLSFVGDAYQSYANSGGAVGNPGIYVTVPEPSSIVLLLIGAALCGRRRRVS